MLSKFTPNLLAMPLILNKVPESPTHTALSGVLAGPAAANEQLGQFEIALGDAMPAARGGSGARHYNPCYYSRGSCIGHVVLLPHPDLARARRLGAVRRTPLGGAPLTARRYIRQTRFWQSFCPHIFIRTVHFVYMWTVGCSCCGAWTCCSNKTLVFFSVVSARQRVNLECVASS